MSYLLTFASAIVLSAAFVLGTFWWAVRRMKMQENKVLRHLPEAEREEARRQLGDMVDLMWPGSHDSGSKIQALKTAFLSTYERHSGVKEALAVFLSDHCEERDKARGGPFLRGAHTIGG